LQKDESQEIDEAITFRELRVLFEQANILPQDVELSDFDPPHAGRGAIFPVSRGLMQTVNIFDDLIEGNITVAEGRIGFQEAIKEWEARN